MPPTEHIIWEAKRRPTPPQEVRRPLTTVDASGCVIIRGFVVPSRTSSFDSVAVQSTTPSSGSASAPASPSREVPSRPQLLAGSRVFECSPPVASVHRATKSASSLEIAVSVSRPSPSRRRDTSQGTSSKRSGSQSCRWENDELAETICNPLTPSPASRLSNLSPDIIDLLRYKKPIEQVRRTQSELVNCKSLGKPHKRRSRSNSKKKDTKTRTARLQDEPHFENVGDSAIASDSEDDRVGRSKRPSKVKCRAKVNRISYAERRARNDARAQQTGFPTASTQAHNENAIESEGDGDDDSTFRTEELSAALSLARIHRSRNSETVKAVPDKPISRPSSGAKVKLSRPNEHSPSKDVTAIEVRSYETGASVTAQQDLRPSRSRPRPAKSVLKSRSQSRGVSPEEKREGLDEY